MADSSGKFKNCQEHGKETDAFYEEFAKKQGEPFWISVAVVADHIDHIKNLVGIDYVGLGSDSDGVGVALPKDLGRCGHDSKPDRRTFQARVQRNRCAQNLQRQCVACLAGQ